MDLRISVVLLLIFLSGGHSLKCYTCKGDLTGSCDAKVETCGYGLSKCKTTMGEQYIGRNSFTVTTKQCASSCASDILKPFLDVVDYFYGWSEDTTHCCDTDLCNAPPKQFPTGGRADSTEPHEDGIQRLPTGGTADGVYKGSFLLLLPSLLFYFLFQ
ncbi:phospholipase A2 inhibitor and Ly6/PLAUR domain-containing protein-like [Labeo rohita]|uniref:phospholipase A2 inhibitor and Ly6/PLAUR domain-containing protein-like n=1 Tax=Labeo rohita TaxID=84645 RepID=UPI0021E31F6D|nr:phospholipase A2 inhibitor and Ly6/PLAUR domain-containing protein-like [Labeo rohita]